MNRLLGAHAHHRLEELRLRMTLLRHSHVEWLANYLEWEQICRRGEDLEPELAIARANIDQLRREMAGVQRRADFWNGIAQRATKTTAAL